VGVAVRPMTAADVPAVAGIIAVAFNDVFQRHGFPAPWPEPHAAEVVPSLYVSYPGARGFVAQRDGRLVGSGFALIRGDNAGIGPVSVAPEAQGSGAGRAIMERLLHETRDCSSVRLIQEAFNNVSFSLYSKLGFVVRDVAPLLVAEDPRPKPPANAPNVRPMTPADLGSVAALDEQVTGMRREPDFALLLGFASQLVCERDGRLTGFLCRAPFGDSTLLAPAAAEEPDDLKALLCGAVQLPGPRLTYLRPTASQPEVLRYVFDAGFVISNVGTYMVRGEWQPPRGAHLVAMFPEAI
jgi:GNAT superfamily N-acetyltransferase